MHQRLPPWNRDFLLYTNRHPTYLQQNKSVLEKHKWVLKCKCNNYTVNMWKTRTTTKNNNKTIVPHLVLNRLQPKPKTVKLHKVLSIAICKKIRLAILISAYSYRQISSGRSQMTITILFFLIYVPRCIRDSNDSQKFKSFLSLFFLVT